MAMYGLIWTFWKISGEETASRLRFAHRNDMNRVTSNIIELVDLAEFKVSLGADQFMLVEFRYQPVTSPSP